VRGGGHGITSLDSFFSQGLPIFFRFGRYVQWTEPVPRCFENEFDDRLPLVAQKEASRKTATAFISVSICYHTAPNFRLGAHILSQISHEAAYPGIRILPRSRNWWAWLKGSPAECIHLEHEAEWVATLLPDTLYLRGKRVVQRDPERPEVVLCRTCLANTLASELVQYAGRVVAFEPDSEIFTQYFFVAGPDFEAAGLAPDVAAAIEKRLAQQSGPCVLCERMATWLWFPRDQVASLDEVEKISGAAGEPLCAEHGIRRLCGAFEEIREANLFYVNLPYGDAGAYLWI
jgi:hypothetical protein